MRRSWLEVGMDWQLTRSCSYQQELLKVLVFGLLTARLGIKAMELCRPLPWIDNKPKLGDFRKELIGKLKIPW